MRQLPEFATPADNGGLDKAGAGGPRQVAIGTASYYLERLGDFERRSPNARAPSYYAEYGNKYLHRFLATKPSLSPRGQQWVHDTMRLLQEMMEQERCRDPRGFAALEHDNEAFRDFAFGTHSRAYYRAGVFDLCLRDLWKIARTPDLSDLLSDDGLREILRLMLNFERVADMTMDHEPSATIGTGALAAVARSARRVRSGTRRLRNEAR